MKCIVTAGPTYEELDQVRRLTNFSTGTLGTELANFLTGAGHEVMLLRGHYATTDVKPKTTDVEIFTTTSDLARRLKGSSSGAVGAIFHAAAVSDFSVGKIWRRASKGNLVEVRAGKFSTRDGALMAELKPTRKIISSLRTWYPKAHIVGWKYEVDGKRKDAVAAAERQLKENRTDACVANGPAFGAGFGIVRRNSPCLHYREKSELFGGLLEITTQLT